MDHVAFSPCANYSDIFPTSQFYIFSHYMKTAEKTGLMIIEQLWQRRRPGNHFQHERCIFKYHFNVLKFSNARENARWPQKYYYFNKNKLSDRCTPSLHTSAHVSHWPAENPRGWGVAHGVSMDARTEFPKVTKISLSVKISLNQKISRVTPPPAGPEPLPAVEPRNQGRPHLIVVRGDRSFPNPQTAVFR